MKPHVVTIGGGKGHAELLRGLKEHAVELTAIVSVMDSGGSSGVLREEYQMLPPGDLRRTVAALSTSPATATWNERDADGHAHGNWEVKRSYDALRDSLQRTMTEAIGALQSTVGARGRVLPVTETLTTLVATLTDGTVLEGEHRIDVPVVNDRAPIARIALQPAVTATPEVIDALERADVVVLTMGDLYTSVLPNFLVGGVVDAITRSGARVITVCNRTTKRGETDHYTLADFYRAWASALAPVRVWSVLVDVSPLPVPEGTERVRVVPLPGEVEVIEANLVDDGNPERISGIKAARVIMDLCGS